jgi:hypothetical protein
VVTGANMNPLLAILAFILAPAFAWAAAGSVPPTLPPVTGEVLEVLDVDAFTYLRLRTAKGETWAATSRTAVPKGTQVTLEDPVAMRDFESKTLKRKFDVVYFGKLAGSGAAAAAAKGAGAPAAGADLSQIHKGVGQAPDLGVVKVAKAEGANARTVAEVNAERAGLRDKPVVIRAKVVKVTPGVMGKNWIHLRDGTGSAADGSNDVVVTSKDEPKVGDVVVARGLVRTDVNLGSGYAYKVLVEDVAFQK